MQYFRQSVFFVSCMKHDFSVMMDLPWESNDLHNLTSLEDQVAIIVPAPCEEEAWCNADHPGEVFERNRDHKPLFKEKKVQVWCDSPGIIYFIYLFIYLFVITCAQTIN